jgi:hypothetical protein
MNNLYSQHEFSPYSFNISMSNMVIMHIRHLKLIWETLCRFAHLDVKWTIYHLTLENLFDNAYVNICTMCVDVKWTTYSLDMNFLSMSIQHVLTLLTRCQINMSNCNMRRYWGDLNYNRCCEFLTSCQEMHWLPYLRWRQ